MDSAPEAGHGGPGETAKAAEVALINMPFTLLSHPSLGLGLLKAGLRRNGRAARVYNASIWFAERIGVELYERMAMAQPTDLTGEWSFSAALFGEDAEADATYAREILRTEGRDDARSQLASLPAALVEVRRHVEPFLERCLRDIPWDRFRIAGFTSTFQQHVASLALARRLKERHPHLVIVFGGANCEGPMGAATFSGFPFIDAVCSGEGDAVFPELCERVLTGRPIGAIAGVRHRAPAAPGEKKARLPALRQLEHAEPLAPAVHDMDALPYPDFDEYFDEMSSVFPGVRTRLLFETSRGCWWGQKHHCTFCGLNGSTMAFRHKSARRALEEIAALIERYGDRTRSVGATDNIIPTQYFKDFLPALRDMRLELDLFYETKSNLRKEQIELYRAAGLRQIQPGIESLSTPVLALMRKGVTMLQNVQALKWCRQYGVAASWNHIVGFPGERPEHYEGLDEVARSIAHLEPPDGWGNVRFDRFSPYFMSPGDFGVHGLRPYPAYRHVYRGLSDAQRAELAYYFEGDFAGRESIESYTAPLVAALDDWREHGSSYALFSIDLGDHLQVFDLRPGAGRIAVSLAGLSRAVYEACDSIATRAVIGQRVAAAVQVAPGLAELEAAIRELLGHRLLLAEGEQLLALGIPLGHHYAPSGPARARFIEAMKSLEP
ncbi:MAG TPA: RiPP maturation radical SAM C-methyltransferase [Sorangium sp.]|nr:RiPP maturation radical SAM C-methyltransferase [Sorangium sp.]